MKPDENLMKTWWKPDEKPDEKRDVANDPLLIKSQRYVVTM